MALLQPVLTALALAASPCAAQGPGVHDLSGPVWKELELRATTPLGAGGLDEGRALSYAPDGARLFVAGSRGTGLGSSYWTLCHDAVTGALEWEAFWTGLSTEFAWPHDLCVAPDGERVWVSGFGTEVGQGQRGIVQALDAAQGGELWVYTFGTPGFSWAARNLVASGDGGTVFTCLAGHQGLPISPLRDARLVALDGQSGAELWLATPTLPPEGGALWAVDLVPGTPRIAAAGEWGKAADSLTPGNTEALVALHRTTTGAELWSTRLDLPGDHYVGLDDALYDVAVAPDGLSVAACGQADAFPARDFLVVLLDAEDGSLLWSDALDQGLADLAADCAWSPDGASLYACGELDKAFAAVAYDAATGTRRWLRTVPGAGFNDRAQSIAVTPDGQRVVATGYVSSPAPGGGTGTQWDYLTVAWDAATGAEVWRARYDSGYGWSDPARRIALAPDGLHAAVTGSSQTPVHAVDILTITYRLLPTAATVDLGGGCPGSLGLPGLDATLPLVGAPLELVLSSVQAGAPALLLVAPTGAAVDLAGCALVVDPAGAAVLPGVAGAGGEVTWTAALPLDPGLAGLALAVHAGALDPGAPWPSIAVAPGKKLVLGG